jgi:hypothetical protein
MAIEFNNDPEWIAEKIKDSKNTIVIKNLFFK